MWAMTSGKSVCKGVWEMRLASGKVKIKETDLVLVPAADHELCHPMAHRRRSLGWPAPRGEKREDSAHRALPSAVQRCTWGTPRPAGCTVRPTASSALSKKNKRKSGGGGVSHVSFCLSID